MAWDSSRRLIVNADDFGRSSDINHAVVQAHQQGILTATSLMVNGDAADEAVELAHQNPDLGVGLHLTLTAGRAALAPSEIPGLLPGRTRELDGSATRAGLRYFFQRSLRPQIQKEIEAQLHKFHQTDLRLDHVNGHLNIHLHPVVIGILAAIAPEHEIRAIRLTRDLFWLNARIARGRWWYRISHALIFAALAARAEPLLAARRIRHTRWVFGLLQSGCMNEEYLKRLLPRLPAGDSELYFHPSLREASGERELQTLISPGIHALIQRQNVPLIRYQDL